MNEPTARRDPPAPVPTPRRSLPPRRRRHEVERVLITREQIQIPDLFVVGYGLDFAERYRNLPFVGVLHPHMYGTSGKC